MNVGSQDSWHSRFTSIFAGNGTFVQVFRFAVLGLKSNVLYYLLYTGLTGVGVAPMVAVVIVFFFSICYAFTFNRRFVFRSREGFHGELLRYVGVYAVALCLNLVLLDFGTRKLGYSHFLVQGVLIVAIAAIIFIALKFFVFRIQQTSSENSPQTSEDC